MIMIEESIEIAKKDWKYHFFILYSCAIFPVNFSKHFRIVTINKWIIHRREIWHFKNRKNPELYYFHRDLSKPTTWLQKFLRRSDKHRKAYLAYHKSWGEKSLIHKIVSFIENSYSSYPYSKKYILFPWPNSNTYIQRILNHFPQIKFQLPRNAFGKTFKFK